MFISLFYPLFLIAVILFYAIVPKSSRPFLLLVASILFCLKIDIRSSIYIVVMSIYTYIFAVLIENYNVKRKKNISIVLVIISIAVIVMQFLLYRYASYVFRFLDMSSSKTEVILSKLIIPIGLSFYTLQMIGYLVDVFREKHVAEKNLVHVCLGFSLFAKFTSGPIEDEHNVMNQIKNLKNIVFWDKERLSMALTNMIYGYFLKMVVADRLNMPVNIIFDNPKGFDSFWLFCGVILYTIQIYCDFAGYSYIAIGSAQIFGISLIQNFHAPYFAKSINEFWRRWHISLGLWLKEYIYIPLGGNQKGVIVKCINTMIVFLICGMWHGAGMNYLVWGALHGMYVIVDAVVRRKKILAHGSTIITFFEVAFAWIFFRASSLSAAINYIGEIFTNGIQRERILENIKTLQLDTVGILLIMILIIILYIVERLSNIENSTFPQWIQGKKNIVRYLIIYTMAIMIFVFGVYGSGYQAEQFVYMQF